MQKDRLFQRSEFLSFSLKVVQSSPGSVDGALSLWCFSLFSRRKKKYEALHMY